jgi:5-methylcytosine-specific restriction endonuclease McrA
MAKRSIIDMSRVVMREEAVGLGLKVWFPMKPCKNGHIDTWRVENNACSECVRIRSRQWGREHPERVAARCVLWNANNPGVSAKRTKTWVSDNPESWRSIQRNRRARKKGAEGSHTTEDITRIYAAQNGKCGYCRKPVGKNFHVDHIKALKCGGSNDPRNIQILCPDCNRRKRDRAAEAFARSMGLLI